MGSENPLKSLGLFVNRSPTQSQRRKVCVFLFFLAGFCRLNFRVFVYYENIFLLIYFALHKVFVYVLTTTRNWEALPHRLYMWKFIDSLELCYLAKWKLKSNWEVVEIFGHLAQYRIPVKHLYLWRTKLSGVRWFPQFSREFFFRIRLRIWVMGALQKNPKKLKIVAILL